jgi:drug/metabolite transporter (DMT)-like permease
MSDSLAAAATLALVSAVAYGASDFAAGLLSRRTSAWAVATVSQGTAAIATLLLAAAGFPDMRSGDLFWALLAGLGGGAGYVLLYRGLARGRMAVVAPITAVVAAIGPVVAGVVGGERPGPATWAGIAVALPAIWCIAEGGRLHDLRRHEVADGLGAGLVFSIQLSALGQIPRASGLAPLALSQVVSVVAIIGAAAMLNTPWAPRDRWARLGAVAGLLAGAATVAFQVAAQTGHLAVAGVVTSLYPATTVVLAALFLRERLSASQGAGLALAGAAIALIASG